MWEKVSLKDVCTLLNGRAYKKPELLSEGKYPVLRVGNFFSNRSWYYSDLELDAKKYCDNGDLLYAWSASFGPRIWEGEKVIYHYHIWKCELNESKVDKKFLFYWFDWDAKKVQLEQGAGTTMIHVTKGAMESRGLLLPPLEEQKRIVGILDEAFAGIDQAIANTEKNLRSCRELLANSIDMLFDQKGSDWKETTLEKLLITQPRNGWSPPAANHSSSGIPVLTLSSVTGFQFKVDKVKFTSASTDNNRHYWVKNGDFLITRSNTPQLVGHVAIVSGLTEPTIYPDLIMRMNPDPEKIVTEFLYYQLQTSCLRDEITSRAHGANPTMKKITKGEVQSLPISAPPIERQVKIVAMLSTLSIKTQRLDKINQQKLTALKELKQSLLQKAFAGELTSDIRNVA